MSVSRNASNGRLGEHVAEKRWYCIYTAPARESMAAEYLRSKMLDVYNPVLPARFPRSRQKKVEPLFPRYLFARFALNRDIDIVRYGQGVASVISDMDGPLPVPDGVIDEIRQRLDAGFYNEANLEAGQTIRVESGAFKGVTGIFHAYASGQERVRILMDLMNRPVLVECDLRAVSRWRPASAGEEQRAHLPGGVRPRTH